MQKHEGQLLASAPTLEALRSAICQFYGGESKTLIPVAEHEWKIVDTYTGNETRGAVRVIRKRNRYRFESC